MSKEQLKDLCERLLEPKVETTVIYESKPSKNDLHPTMKPVKLFARIMLNSSRAGENILDIFGGSGTTIVAAEQLNRKGVRYGARSEILRRYHRQVGKIDGTDRGGCRMIDLKADAELYSALRTLATGATMEEIGKESDGSSKIFKRKLPPNFDAIKFIFKIAKRKR